MLWAVLAVLAALAWSFVNVLDKLIVTKYTRKPIVPILFIGAIGLLGSLVIYLIKGYSPMPPQNIVLALAIGGVTVSAILLYFKALQLEEVSRVIPLLYLSPLFILVMAALFLGEIFQPVRYAGIFLIVLGAVLISTRNFRKMAFGKAAGFMVGSTMVGSVGAVLTKHLLNTSDVWTFFAYSRIGMFLALVPFFFINFSDLASTVKKHGARAVGVITLSESLGFAGAVLIIFATKLGFVTLVTALSSIQALFVLVLTVILSVYFPKIMKEEIGKKTLAIKLLSIILMFIGVILIT